MIINDHTEFRTGRTAFARLRQSGLRSGGRAQTLCGLQAQKMLVVRSSALAGLKTLLFSEKDNEFFT
ncbi:MAG: hypothetical protein KUG52_05625 [Immundisolibacteraceae bacterium]|nr:hypothetical protein [Immundisolibacteraceae bacterium]